VIVLPPWLRLEPQYRQPDALQHPNIPHRLNDLLGKNGPRRVCDEGIENPAHMCTGAGLGGPRCQDRQRAVVKMHCRGLGRVGEGWLLCPPLPPRGVGLLVAE